ncbi:MAG: methyltransferase [Burkholderiales bacterium]|jgi:hypothetical protein|nr:methyltransferase [Burkholderiales bacterium]
MRGNETGAAPDRLRAPRGVWGEFGYLEDPSGPSLVYLYEDGAGSEAQARFTRVAKFVEDLRARVGAGRPRIDVHGFELVDAPSAVGDFWCEEEVRGTYYPELQELALELTGGRRAYVFDHLCRRREAGRPPLTFGRAGDGSHPAAVGRVHNDYSERSGASRLGKVICGEHERRSSDAYCIVNVWRPIVGPIVDTPLALCDAATVHARDMHACEIRYPERNGEIAVFTDSPRHRWSYASEMRATEALVFKQYDSRVNGVPRFVPHAAFDLPLRDDDAPLRQSIEARCLVTFD